MMKRVVLFSLLTAVTAAAEVPVARVADDAKAVDRVAAASKRDLPRDLLRRMINDDIELLRGHRSDGAYEYASYERMEAGRTSESLSVTEKEQRLELRGSFVYRLLIESPSRRLLVTKNRRVWVDRVEIEYIPDRGGPSKIQNVKIESWLEPGTNQTIDLTDIARQATVRVYAHSDKDAGYGNIVLSLIQARVFDNPDSPYADAVASAKAILRGLDHDDVPSIRAMATRMYNDLQPAVVGAAAGAPPKTIEVIAPRTNDAEIYQELQAIEDLLTGTENERRQGLDRLHQFIRKFRPQQR
jgi:hypothetical protein